jgi:uncharacterized membrane protein YozB (DUF420 family)
MGFLGTTASNFADANLILQIVLVVLLIWGRTHAKSRKYRNHGNFMAVAVGLNIISFLLVMGPSMALGWGIVVSEPTNPGVIISVIHAIGGGFALLSGVYLVASWRFADSFGPCMGKRTQMRATIGLWLLSTLTGIAFYIYYYL